MNNKELIKIYKIYCNKIINNSICLLDDSSTSSMSDFLTNVKKLNESLKKHFVDVDFYLFNKEELFELGLVEWDENLILLSPLMMSLVKDGTMLTTINGDVVEVGKDAIDKDTRFGMLGYGIEIYKLRDNKINQIIN